MIEWRCRKVDQGAARLKGIGVPRPVGGEVDGLLRARVIG